MREHFLKSFVLRSVRLYAHLGGRSGQVAHRDHIKNMGGLKKGAPKVLAHEHAAKSAGLRYVIDEPPGIRRVGSPKDFKFQTDAGRPVRDEKTLARIKSLVIPPAWTNVWICPDEHGHLQVTGRDARGRKQHRYHQRWREVRDETKYNRMLEFARVLPQLRQRLHKDLNQKKLSRTKVLAAVVAILETGLIRVGNEEYVRQNKSFGLTTMRDQHVDINGSTIRFEFRGKSGKQHSVDIQDKRLARIVKSCQDIPGQELFQYFDNAGKRRGIASGDVNEYLREITGSDFTAKDFRTWAGTVLAAMALREFEAFDSQTQAKKHLVRAIERVAERLGNTPTVCRKCYIHPHIMEAYLEGSTVQVAQLRTEKQLRTGLPGLTGEEAAVLAFLKKRLQQQRTRPGLLTQLKSSVKASKAARGKS